jgi:hypothetical protein
MKTTIKFLTGGLLIIAMVLTACSKDGEAGAIGPQGVSGQDGQDGLNGVDGEDGNANVIYSDWITVQGSEWLPNTGTVARKNTTLTAPEITQVHIDAGVVLVYVQKVFSTSPNSIVLLPVDDNEFEFVVDGIDVGEIVVKARRLDLGTFSNNFVPVPFRYVIIPGGVAAAGKGGLNYTKMSYEEVMDHFGLDY